MPDACFLRSELLASHGAIGIFSLRHGGISPSPFDSLNFGYGLGDMERNIEHNLDILIRHAALFCLPHRAAQVHGTGTLTCRGKGKMHWEKADILIGSGQTAVAVQVADCVPVLLAAPEAELVAAVHAGWRGTVLQAAVQAVKAMHAHGAGAGQILACIGPCIGPCCFKVDTVTAEKLADCTDGAAAFIRHRQGKTYADLAEINKTQLLLAGIKSSHIERIAACTCCDGERFYSYRRDGKQSGRHLAVVALPKAT